MHKSFIKDNGEKYLGNASWLHTLSRVFLACSLLLIVLVPFRGLLVRILPAHPDYTQIFVQEWAAAYAEATKLPAVIVKDGVTWRPPTEDATFDTQQADRRLYAKGYGASLFFVQQGGIYLLDGIQTKRLTPTEVAARWNVTSAIEPLHTYGPNLEGGLTLTSTTHIIIRDLGLDKGLPLNIAVLTQLNKHYHQALSAQRAFRVRLNGPVFLARLNGAVFQEKEKIFHSRLPKIKRSLLISAAVLACLSIVLLVCARPRFVTYLRLKEVQSRPGIFEFATSSNLSSLGAAFIEEHNQQRVLVRRGESLELERKRMLELFQELQRLFDANSGEWQEIASALASNLPGTELRSIFLRLRRVSRNRIVSPATPRRRSGSTRAQSLVSHLTGSWRGPNLGRLPSPVAVSDSADASRHAKSSETKTGSPDIHRLMLDLLPLQALNECLPEQSWQQIAWTILVCLLDPGSNSASIGERYTPEVRLQTEVSKYMEAHWDTQLDPGLYGTVLRWLRTKKVLNRIRKDKHLYSINPHEKQTNGPQAAEVVRLVKKTAFDLLYHRSQ